MICISSYDLLIEKDDFLYSGRICCKLYNDFVSQHGGATTYDLSGNRNNGTLSGTSWTVGGISFDGVDDKETVPYFEVINGTNPFSVCIGLKFDTIPSVKGENETIMQQQDGAGTGRIWVQGLSSSDKIGSKLGGTFLTHNTVVEADKWYFVCVVYDGTKLYVYINNDSGVSTPRTPDEGATGDYEFGVNKLGTGARFDGIINFRMLCLHALNTQERTFFYEQWRRML